MISDIRAEAEDKAYYLNTKIDAIDISPFPKYRL